MEENLDDIFGVKSDSSQGSDLDDIFGVKPKRSALGEIGTGLKRGVIGQLPDTAGKAMQWASDPNGGEFSQKVNALGARISDSAEKTLARPDLQLNPESHNATTNALASGAEMIAPSVAVPLAIGAGLALAPEAAVTGTAALSLAALGGAIPMGMAQAQSTYENVKDAGGTDEAARIAGWKSGGYETGGEFIGNVLGGKALGFGAKILRKAVKPTIESALGTITNKGVLKPFAKQMGITIPGEIATEMGQSYGQASVEKNAGVDVDPWQQAKDVVGPTIGMSVLLGPLGLAGHFRNSQRAKAIDTILTDPNAAKPEERNAIVEMLHKEAVANKIPDADKWLAGAKDDIASGSPVRRDTYTGTLDKALRQSAMGTSYTTPAIGAVPENTPENSGFSDTESSVPVIQQDSQENVPDASIKDGLTSAIPPAPEQPIIDQTVLPETPVSVDETIPEQRTEIPPTTTTSASENAVQEQIGTKGYKTVSGANKEIKRLGGTKENYEVKKVDGRYYPVPKQATQEAASENQQTGIAKDEVKAMQPKPVADTAIAAGHSLQPPTRKIDSASGNGEIETDHPVPPTAKYLSKSLGQYMYKDTDGTIYHSDISPDQREPANVESAIPPNNVKSDIGNVAEKNTDIAKVDTATPKDGESGEMVGQDNTPGIKSSDKNNGVQTPTTFTPSEQAVTTSEQVETSAEAPSVSTVTSPSKGEGSDEIFVRKPTTKEKVGGAARSSGFNTIPDRDGYEKVYKPYGTSGDKADAGYYYKLAPKLTTEGRRTDGKPILPGDTFTTSSNRRTTPYPKYSPGRTTKGDIKKANKWTIENAAEEAKSRGDEYNHHIFSSIANQDAQQADIEGALQYLFGEQPKIVKSILKPIITPPDAVNAGLSEKTVGHSASVKVPAADTGGGGIIATEEIGGQKYEYRVAKVPKEERAASHLTHYIEMSLAGSNNWESAMMGYFQFPREAAKRFVQRHRNLQNVTAIDENLKAEIAKDTEENRIEREKKRTEKEAEAKKDREYADLRNRFIAATDQLKGKFKKQEYTPANNGKGKREVRIVNVYGSFGYEKIGKSYNVVHPKSGYAIAEFDNVDAARNYVLAADALGIKFEDTDGAKPFIEDMRNLSFSIADKGSIDEGIVSKLEKAIGKTAKLSTTSTQASSPAQSLTPSQRRVVAKLEASGKVRMVSAAEAAEVLREAGIDPKYMVAWHGSPHDFDQFSTEKIGTGEGAQVYGHGLYFASAKEVAEYYKESLSDAPEMQIDGKPIGDSIGAYLLKTMSEGVSRQSAIDQIQRKIDGIKNIIRPSEWGKILPAHEDALRLLKDSKTFGMSSPGRLYQVELAPADDEYLLWDRPLSEQSEKVKAALNNIPQSIRDAIDGMGGDGAALYRHISKNIGNKAIMRHMMKLVDEGKISAFGKGDQKASEYLHSFGIRGIKYLDGTSRGKGDGNFNYVIFNDADIKINAKYSKKGKIQGFQIGDKAYIIPENVEQGNLWNVVRHEIGVHLGKALQSEKAFANLLKSIESRSAEQGPTGQAIRAAMERVPNDTNPDHYWEEVLAYATEDSPQVGIVRQFVAMVKRMLVKMGVDPSIFTVADLAALADAAVRREANDSVASQVNEFAQGAKMSLNEAMRKIQNMAAFKKWFDGSKVVDEDGEPLVVYHATRSNFNSFDKVPGSDMGFHFGSNDQANGRLGETRGLNHVAGRGKATEEGERLIPVYLNIKNPLRVEDPGYFGYAELVPQLERMGMEFEGPKTEKQLIHTLKYLGYDGFVYNNENDSEGGGDSFVAFEPTQIKSIFNTKWDGSNPDILASFAGPKANSTNLDRAKEMEQSGASKRDIWKETGWWNLAGEWKYEIDDSLSSVTMKDGLLSEVLDHPALFRDYPQLEKIRVRFEDMGDTKRGGFDPDKRIIRVNTAMDLAQQRSTLHHEVQHIIQTEEGFATGGNLNVETDKLEAKSSTLRAQVSEIVKLLPQYVGKPEYKKLLDLRQEAVTAIRRIEGEDGNGARRIGYRKYMRLAGEAESRLVQRRLNMSPAARKATPPWETLDKMLRKEGLLKDGQSVEDVLISRKSGGVADSVRYSVAAAPFTGSVNSTIAQAQDYLKSKGMDEAAERVAEYFWDKDAAISRVQRTLGPQPLKRDYNTLRRLLGKRISDEIATFDREVLQPLLQHMADNKLKIADVEEYGHAQHAPEANLQAKRVNARRYVDTMMQAMTDKEKAPYADRLIDIQDEFIMNSQTRNQKRDNTVALMDQIADLTIDTYEAQREAIDAELNALDERIWTAEELMAGTPERLQKLLTNRSERLEKRYETAKYWEDVKDRLSGMTNEKAAEITRKWNGNAAIQQAVDTLHKINTDRLDMLHESGELNDDEYKAIKETFQHYVPLMRDGMESDKNPSGRAGLGPLAKPIKVRAGSTKTVVDIFSNTVDLYQAAIARKYKNEAGRALYELVKANPDESMWSIIEQEKIPYYDNEGNIRFYTDQKEAENEVYVKIDGVKYLISVPKDNKSMRRFMDALKREPAKLGPFLKASRYITRIMAALNTSLSPEFILTNFMRDIQTASIHLQTTDAAGMQRAVYKNIKGAVKGIYAAERGDESSDMSKWYRDFSKHGGKIAWMQDYDTVADLAKTIEKELEYKEGKHPNKMKLRKLGKFIEAMNTSVENGVRLATYKVLVENGTPKLLAAKAASNLTVDFTRHGTAGPMINSLWMFANAGIQGNVRLIKALANNKSVQKITGGIVALGFAANILGALGGGDDDDGESYYDKLKKTNPSLFERNMVFMLPGGKGRPYKIPMPYGYNTFFVLGNEIAGALRGQSPIESMSRVMSTLMSFLNPLASATILQTIMPTIGDPIAQVMENKAWHGGNLMPGENPFGIPIPDSERYFKSVNPVAKFIAQGMNTLTGGDKYTPGMIDMSPETLEMMVETYGGSALKLVKDTASVPLAVLSDDGLSWEKTPGVRKFIGSFPDFIDSTIYEENNKKVDVLKSRYAAADGAERSELRADPMFKMLPIHKATESQLRRLNKRLKMVEKAGNNESAKRIKEQMLTVKERYNTKYNSLMK